MQSSNASQGSPGGGVSVIFSLKMAEGQVTWLLSLAAARLRLCQLLYVGFDYSTASEPWIRALTAALEFAS
eukprot:754826-Hanusia_phi.AAC.7